MPSKRTGKPAGRPSDPSKVTTWARIDSEALKGLDEIAKRMDPRPSVSQLIDRAVREFVDRNPTQKQKVI